MSGPTDQDENDSILYKAGDFIGDGVSNFWNGLTGGDDEEAPQNNEQQNEESPARDNEEWGLTDIFKGELPSMGDLFGGGNMKSYGLGALGSLAISWLVGKFSGDGIKGFGIKAIAGIAAFALIFNLLKDKPKEDFSDAAKPYNDKEIFISADQKQTKTSADFNKNQSVSVGHNPHLQRLIARSAVKDMKNQERLNANYSEEPEIHID